MKRAIAVVLGLILVAAAVWGGVTYGPYLRWYARVRWSAIEASRREPAAIEAWQKEFGDPAAIPKVPDDNATAVRLRELAPAAGVDFKKTDYPPSQVAINKYVDSEAMKTGGPVDRPPETVQSYLDAHQTDLDAIVDLLTHGEPPVWKTEDWLTFTSWPPVIGLKQLNQVLVVRALAESSAGRSADADRSLLAAWQLCVSLRNRPLLIEQLIGIAMTQAPAILARRLAVDTTAWRARLGEYDARAGVMHALVAEGSRKWSTGTSQMERAARADYLDVMRVYLVGLRGQPLTAQHVAYREGDALRDGWSTGVIVAMIGQPGLDRAWFSANAMALQLELTDRVLHARELRAQLGKWPAEIPDIDSSRISGMHWIYRVDPNGRISIALNETLKDVGPPLRFESSDPTHK